MIVINEGTMLTLPLELRALAIDPEWTEVITAVTDDFSRLKSHTLRWQTGIIVSAVCVVPLLVVLPVWYWRMAKMHEKFMERMKQRCF